MVRRLVLVILTILACAGDAMAQRHTARDGDSDSIADIVGNKNDKQTGSVDLTHNRRPLSLDGRYPEYLNSCEPICAFRQLTEGSLSQVPGPTSSSGKPQVPGSLDSNGDPLGAWIGEFVQNCIRKNAPRIAVVGFSRNETAVSQEEADEIRFGIANRLHKAGGVVLTSAADVTRLADVLERTTGLSPEEAKKQLHAAFDGDAYIPFVSPYRQTRRVSFRLLAITRGADCEAPSEPIEWPLRGSQSLADVRQLMAKAIKQLVEAAPNVRFVDVLPFSAPIEQSKCSAALTDSLVDALAAEKQDPSRLLNGKTLNVIKVMAPRPAGVGRVSARGSFELDRDNKAFMRLWFEDDGETIASIARVAIATDRFPCDPTIPSVTPPRPAVPAPPTEAEALLERGIDFVREGDDDLAIRAYSQAIDIDPLYARAYIARGEAYRRKRILREALSDFNKAIELVDNDPDAFYDRGFVYTLRNDHVRAVKDYDAAIRLNPGDASSLNNRCLTRAITGHLPLAMEDCNAALRLRPNFADARDSRGFTYLKLGQFNLAIADYNAALRVVPQLADSLYGRGLARLKLGKTADGITDIAAARTIRPDIGEEFVRRGVQDQSTRSHGGNYGTRH